VKNDKINREKRIIDNDSFAKERATLFI